MDNDQGGGCILIIGAILGCFMYFLGAFVATRETEHKIWGEAVRHGYAERIETPCGKMYKWKELSDDTKP